MQTRSQTNAGRPINAIGLTRFEYERGPRPATSANRHIRDDISRMTRLSELQDKARAEGLPPLKHGKFTVRRRELRRAIRERRTAELESASASSLGKRKSRDDEEAARQFQIKADEELALLLVDDATPAPEDAPPLPKKRKVSKDKETLGERNQRALNDQQGRLDGALREKARLQFSVEGIEAGTKDFDFLQHDVNPDNACFWRSFALAHLGDQERWREVRKRTQDLYNAVMTGEIRVDLRLQLYCDLAEANKDLHRELFTDGEWGSTDAAQILADAYGVFIAAFRPQYNKQEQAKDDPAPPSYGEVPEWSLQCRGQPHHPPIYLVNYHGNGDNSHWEALEVPEGVEVHLDQDRQRMAWRTHPLSEPYVPEELPAEDIPAGIYS